MYQFHPCLISMNIEIFLYHCPVSVGGVCAAVNEMFLYLHTLLSVIWRGLIVIKWGDIKLKLWCIYHLVSIILYCIYRHRKIVCVMCIDCILLLSVASSSLVTRLAICRWLYYLHFLRWCFTLYTHLFLLVALTGYLFICVSFLLF
jgi:hypothetical protein